ncbi:hypothetical protein CNYM01_13088 [Colletotrichum nymphaeae SA-01]|uniref:Uncharacterized protein n=1 Tax=Colletotrichum nymphaeae SA-01 TaxID=1460502 RepID=A0A135SMZ8_9PEZI|nr:hypothetical protein CNYM01_13088 [Colletotrichum nymphaeae SA-01]
MASLRPEESTDAPDIQRHPGVRAGFAAQSIKPSPAQPSHQSRGPADDLQRANMLTDRGMVWTSVLGVSAGGRLAMSLRRSSETKQQLRPKSMTSVAAKPHFLRFRLLPYGQPFCGYCLTLPLHCLTDGSEERYQNTRTHRANHDENDNGEAPLAMQHQPGLAKKDMSCAPRGPCPVPVTVSFTFRCTGTLCLLVSWSGLVPPARFLLLRPPSNKIG